MSGNCFVIDGEDISSGARLMRYNIERGVAQGQLSSAADSNSVALVSPPSPSGELSLYGHGARAPKRRHLDMPPTTSMATEESVEDSSALLGTMIPNPLPIDTETPPLSPDTKRRLRFNLQDSHYFRGDLNDLRHNTLYHLATRHSHQQILDQVNKYHPAINFTSRDLSYRMNGCMKSLARHSNRHRREVKADLDAARRENGVDYTEGKTPEEVDEGPVVDEMFEEDPVLLKGERLLELEAKYTHSQIVTSVNFHHPAVRLTSTTLAERLKDAINGKARVEGKTYAEVRAELDTLREANGTRYAHQNGSFTNERAGLSYRASPPVDGAMGTDDTVPETQQSGSGAVIDMTAILHGHPNNLRGQALIDVASQMSYPDILSEIKSRHPSSELSGSVLSSRLQSALKSKALRERRRYEEVRNELTGLQRANNLANVKKVYKRREK